MFDCVGHADNDDLLSFFLFYFVLSIPIYFNFRSHQLIWISFLDPVGWLACEAGTENCNYFYQPVQLFVLGLAAIDMNLSCSTFCKVIDRVQLQNSLRQMYKDGAGKIRGWKYWRTEEGTKRRSKWKPTLRNSTPMAGQKKYDH